jgi:hypothetical protein
LIIQNPEGFVEEGREGGGSVSGSRKNEEKGKEMKIILPQLLLVKR